MITSPKQLYRAGNFSRVSARSLGKPPAAYPGRVATDRDLAIAVDQQQTRLASPMSASDVVMTVADPSMIAAYSLLSIDSEIVQATGPPSGNIIPVSRGFDGTTPAVHLASATVSGFVDAWHHNALVAEVEAIETALGANLSRVPASPFYVTSTYNFPAIAGSGSLAPGNNQITLTPMPQGLALNNALYVSGGTGAAEAATITGISGNQVIINCANAHSGAWTIQSASAGIQETIIVAANAGGGHIIVPPGPSPVYATINLKSGISMEGAGIYETYVQRTGDFGDTFSAVQKDNLSFSNFNVQQVVNYTPGTPGTAVNIPTHGAHFDLIGCNTITFTNMRFETMYYDVRIDGGSKITFYHCDFYGVWDGRAGSPKITQTGLLLDQYDTATYGIPTWIRVIGCNFVGANNGSTQSPTNNPAVGPAYGLHILCVEDFQMIGGYLGGSNINNIILETAAGFHILANVQLIGVRFDSAGNCDFIIAGDGTHNASSISLTGCLFNGEIAGQNAIQVSGTNAVLGLNITGCQIFAYYASGIYLNGGSGIKINNNLIYYYNLAKATNPLLSAGIGIGGSCTKFSLLNNTVGGGQAFGDYDNSTNCCLYGIWIGALGTTNVGTLFGNNTPNGQASIGTASDLVFMQAASAGTFATLPPAPALGSYAAVTDSTVNTWGTAIAGGGANKVLAFYNGSQWTVAGK